jgi:hypothetical protein
MEASASTAIAFIVAVIKTALWSVLSLLFFHIKLLGTNTSLR